MHEKDAGLFYMIDGTATLVTGGKHVGNARQPRQRPAGGDLVDVLDPGVDDGSLIMGAG